jgi:hypothetical protein
VPFAKSSFAFPAIVTSPFFEEEVYLVNPTSDYIVFMEEANLPAYGGPASTYACLPAGRADRCGPASPNRGEQAGLIPFSYR